MDSPDAAEPRSSSATAEGLGTRMVPNASEIRMSSWETSGVYMGTRVGTQIATSSFVQSYRRIAELDWLYAALRPRIS